MPPTLESAVYSPSPSVRPVVPTEAGTRPPVLHRSRQRVWQKFIDEKLIEWATNPDYFDNEDFEGPSPEVVSLALRFAQQFRDTDQPPPHRVVPDADGGIVFELTGRELTEKIHFWDNGDVEYLIFRAGKVIERQPLQPA
ncbi:MAG: hypothetical protein R3C59_30830 [Planctomycetaceae bacterium]